MKDLELEEDLKALDPSITSPLSKKDKQLEEVKESQERIDPILKMMKTKQKEWIDCQILFENYLWSQNPSAIMDRKIEYGVIVDKYLNEMIDSPLQRQEQELLNLQSDYGKFCHYFSYIGLRIIIVVFLLMAFMSNWIFQIDYISEWNSEFVVWNISVSIGELMVIVFLYKTLETLTLVRRQKLNCLKRLLGLVQYRETDSSLFEFDETCYFEVPVMNKFCIRSLDSWNQLKMLANQYFSRGILMVDVIICMIFAIIIIFFFIVVVDLFQGDEFTRDIRLTWSFNSIFIGFLLMLAGLFKEWATINNIIPEITEEIEKHLEFLKELKYLPHEVFEDANVSPLLDEKTTYSIQQIQIEAQNYKEMGLLNADSNSRDYLDMLIEKTEEISSFIESQQELEEEKFLGIIPIKKSILVSFLVTMYLTFLPSIIGIVQKFIKYIASKS